ncbi:MAG: hypothetical protein GXP47_13625 [Acidobacteria bacterium]|nr:hypothetical protein [Acidobacteriota bacterium]
MKRYRRIAGLVNIAAVLVAWHGVLLSLPHTHGDRNVPRYAEVCTATHPGSMAVHLHPAPELIPPHGCLACLVSSAHGASIAAHRGVMAPRSLPVRTTRIICRRADTYRHLPSLRAPPSKA